MRTPIRVLLYSLVIFSSTACQAQTKQIEVLDPAGFEAKLNSTQNKTLVDVRTPDEFSQGHLPQALLIDFWADDFQKKIAQLDKTKPVFVYCGTGRRSSGAAKALQKIGFTQIYDLDGGIEAWKDAGKKLVK